MSMTMGEILLQMAVELGVNDYDDDGLPALPGNPATLKRLRDAFQAGRVTMYADHPKAHFLRPSGTITLDPTGLACIGGDAGRYALRSGIIAPPLGVMTCSSPSGNNTRRGTVVVTSWKEINELRAADSSTTGFTRYAAFWPMESLNINQAPRFEMRIYPKPDVAYILEAPFGLDAAPMANDDEVEPSGYPLAVKAYGIYEFQKANPVGTGTTQEVAAAERLAWSQRIKTNEEMREPRTLGRTAHARPRGSRMYTGSDRATEWVPIPVTLSDGSVLGA